MASIYDFKPGFQKLLRPVSDRLFRCGITANTVTITAAIISLLEGILISLFHRSHWPLLLLPLILFIRMTLNAVDGMIAREHHMQTRLGTVLNELGDVFSDTCLYLPFAMIPGIYPPIIIFIVILAILSEMTGIAAIQIGSKRRYEGPMGKSDRAFVFGLIGLLLGIGIHANIWFNIILGFIVLMLIITITNRIVSALRDSAYGH
jgi:CDP-diacylglycerol--glycerol-3-phosphate 3-phosphatidyltransferase